jgi:hypothetical protein
MLEKHPTSTMPRLSLDRHNADTFISQQLSAAQKGALGVALAQASAALAEGDVDNDSAMHDLTLCIENLLYEAHLRSGADCDVLTATPIRTRTSGDPHAIRELAPRTIENRRNAFVKTYQQLIGDKKAIPQQPYNWIKDVDQCVAAVAAAWTSYSSWQLNCYAFANVVEALNERELAMEYRRRFLAQDATRKKHTSSPKDKLTPAEHEQLWKAADALGRKAIKLLQETPDAHQPARDNKLAVVQHALVLLLTFGTSAAWSNQRRAMLTYQFKSPHTDVSIENYVDTSGESVLLVVNTATKVKKPQVAIDVSADCPVLAELLKAIAESPNRPPYLLHQYAWRQRKYFGKCYTDGTNYNQRLKEAVKFAGLAADLCKKTGGCNVARHADVAANRKRRALTEAEREHERSKAAKRLSSTTAADTQYAQPRRAPAPVRPAQAAPGGRLAGAAGGGD